MDQHNLTTVDEISPAELNCIAKNETEPTPAGYCVRDWDHILCWPPTAPNTNAVQACFDEFNGVLYDSSQNATRWCDEFGTWNWTNFKQCRELETTDSWSAIIYYTGYSVSLIALSIAVFIFVYYRELRCLRNTIHTNLMCTYILVGFMWILTITLLSTFQGHVSMCTISIILLNYATLTNFFWMFVEGLYLYVLVVQTFTIDNIKLRTYLAIGWGLPIPFVVTWSILKATDTLDMEGSNKAVAEHCPWMIQSPADWAYKIPAIFVLVINVLFLLRIMWVLMSKLRTSAANTAETQQYRKATKALLVLIPLLGITYVLIITLPTQGMVATVLQYLRDFLLSTQGFMVAIFYCFFNTEVRNAIRHRAEVWKETRDINNERRRFASSKESPFVRSESARLFGNQDDNGHRSRYHKRESGASDMTTVTYIGCSNSSGRCRSLSGSNGHTPSSLKAGNAVPVPVPPITNCV